MNFIAWHLLADIIPLICWFAATDALLLLLLLWLWGRKRCQRCEGVSIHYVATYYICINSFGTTSSFTFQISPAVKYYSWFSHALNPHFKADHNLATLGYRQTTFYFVNSNLNIASATMALLKQAHELLCDTIHCELYNFLRDHLASATLRMQENKSGEMDIFVFGWISRAN